MTVLIDGLPVETRELGTGDFEIRATAGETTGPRWVECRFSNTLTLPIPDGRPAVAHIHSVGFEPFDASRSRPPERLVTFPADMSHPKLDATGIATDGWVAKSGKARLWFAGPGRDLVVRGHVPLVGAAFQTEMTLLLDGLEVAKKVLTPGDFEVRLPGGPGPRPGRGGWSAVSRTCSNCPPPTRARRPHDYWYSGSSRRCDRSRFRGRCFRWVRYRD